MLNFRDNFFFIKFTTLFFILTIFGYWGIDLNSEELYIAFSFFLLVMLGVALSRRSILLIFIKSVNSKYFRILSDLLVAAGALHLRVLELHELSVLIVSLRKLTLKLASFTSQCLGYDLQTMQRVFLLRKTFLSTFLSLSSNVFFKNVARVKKFNSFTVGIKFFSIKF